jgi:hypothetical protein
VFSLSLARLGVATGAIGIVAEALRPLIGWAYAIYGIVLFIWLIWVAVALWNLIAASVSLEEEKHAGGTRQPAVA